MADGNALFHGAHKNLAGTGTALDVPNLGKARAAMAKQTGLDGKTLLNLRPTFLVVPSGLVKLPKRLDLARDAVRVREAVPGLTQRACMA